MGRGSATSIGRRRWLGPLLPAVGIMALVAGAGAGATPPLAQPAPDASTRGHAQVVAQMVAPLPAEEVAWRVSYRSVAPDAPSVPEPAPGLGFVLTDQGSLLLTEDPGARRVVLDPGEAAPTGSGADQRRTPAGEQPAAYYAIALVPDPRAAGEAADDGLVFAGSPFPAPPGERELSLVRDVLAPEETGEIVAGEAPTLVLATFGAVEVEAGDGALASLQAGEAAIFDGELALTAVGRTEAVVVAAVVGPEVTPADPNPATPPSAATPAASPVAAVAEAPTGEATIAVTVHGCPSDLAPADFAPDTCDRDPTALSLGLSLAAGGDPAAIEAARVRPDVPIWSDLPLAAYVLRATGIAPGYDRFFVPGLEPADGGAGADGVAPETGYQLRLTDAAPAYRLDAYAFASDARTGTPTASPAASPTAATPQAAATGLIGFRVFRCPGISLESFVPFGCDPAPPGFDVALAGDALEVPLTLSDTEPGDGDVRLWTDLPFGDYVFTLPLLPSDTATYAVSSAATVTPLPDAAGYGVALAAAAPEIVLDVYALAPLPTPVLAPLPPPASDPLPAPAPAPAPLPPTAVPAPLPVVTPPVPPAVPTPVPPAPLPVPTPIPPAAPLPEPTVAPPSAPPPPSDPAAAPPSPPPAPVVDSDGDSLTDDVELAVYGTDPGVFDTDGDGTGDGAEIAAGTDPLATGGASTAAATDADGDGLPDADETAFGTNPAAPDTDGDGFLDGNEVALGTDPANSSSNPGGSG